MFSVFKKHGLPKGLILYLFLAIIGMNSAGMVGGVALLFWFAMGSLFIALLAMNMPSLLNCASLMEVFVPLPTLICLPLIILLVGT
jgi:hypothetical protein